MKVNEILETASAGATGAGAVASVPTTAKAKKQKKNKDGTVKNALDSDNVFAGKTVKR